MTWPRSSTRRARPGRRRAACSRTRTCWPRSTLHGTGWSWTSGMVAYLFLPLAHVLARVDADRRARRRRDRRLLARRPQADRRRAARGAPDALPLGPAHLREGPHDHPGRAEDSAPLKRAIFARALATGRRGAAAGPGGQAGRGARAPAPRRSPTGSCCRRCARAFGDALPSGSRAPRRSAREILEFFDACGVLVLEGYGLTETCAASTLNTPQEQRIGTVGRPLPDTEVRVAADGELLLRGPHVFAGYYRNDEATRESLHGRLAATPATSAPSTTTGFVRITGRKKELIITSSGKNISPTNIEELAARDALDLAGGRVRRQQALPRRAAHARSRRGRQARRARGRGVRRPRRTVVATRRSAPSCRPRSTRSTRDWRASSRSSASRSSTATSASPTAS